MPPQAATRRVEQLINRMIWLAIHSFLKEGQRIKVFEPYNPSDNWAKLFLNVKRARWCC